MNTTSPMQTIRDDPPARGFAAVRLYWGGLVMPLLLVVVIAYGYFMRTPGAPYIIAMVAWLTFIISGFHLLRYLDKRQLARHFQWPHSVGSSLLLMLMSSHMTAVAVLIIFDGLLDEMRHPQASRESMRKAGLISILTLICVVAIRTLAIFEIHLAPPRLSTFEITAFNLTLIVPYCIDILQRLWRFQTQIAAAVSSLHTSNNELAQAEQELQHRLNEHTQLLEVSRAVGSTMELDSLLMRMLVQLRAVVEYGRATVMLLRGDSLVEICTNGTLDRYADRLSSFLNHSRYRDEIMTLTRPTVVGDIGRLMPNTQGSIMAVPLNARGRFIGILSVRHAQCNFYTQHDADLCMAFANQVAGMIDSAQLQEDAASAMVVAERHRLARELHDSVSQSLFGIVLGTRTALEQLAGAPDAARTALAYSVSLASSALADMRALIFTLRPETLEHKGLIAALQAQIDLLQPHHDARIRLDSPDGEPDISLDQKEALYRIAVEGLQNALRHSGGSLVSIRIGAVPTPHLEVVDDGRGFDASISYDGHLGLKTMRERADSLGGFLHIESAPGCGTRVSTGLSKTRETAAR